MDLYQLSDKVSTLLAIGVICIQAITLFIILDNGRENQTKFTTKILANGVFASFVVILLSMMGSLFYSNIIGFEPCILCWYQRIFIFSQIFLLGIALFKKYTNEIYRYTLGLSIIGGLFSLYHFYIKMTGNSPLPCSALGVSSVDCTQQLVIKFGYINIPMMALTTFLFVGTISYLNIKRQK